ncbi:glycerophosphodiester phosphodiesterase [Corynebacterium aquatimens]
MGAVAVLASASLLLASCSNDEGTDKGNSSTPEDNSASTSVHEQASKNNRDDVPPVADNPSPAVKNLPPHFDFEAHRGGRGEWTEESKKAFETALELNATTLELDVVITKDGVPAVWHDPKVQDDKCTDTKPATENDPQFPYVGKLMHELTWDQIQTLDCDLKLSEDFPEQEPVKGNKILQLSDVFEIAKSEHDVYFNIETKIEAEERENSAEPQEFVDAILAAAEEAGTTDRIMIQSFDWRSLPLVREKNPNIPLVALYDETTWVEDSKWIGDIDYKDVDGDVIEAVKKLGAEVISPGFAVPYEAKAGDDDYNPTATREYITKAHEAGIRVVPWTINDPDTMEEQLDAGVDGIITDYPTRLKKILDERGINYARTK